MNENQIMEMFRILTNLTTDVTEIKLTMARMEIRVSNLESGQTELAQGQANLEQGQAKLEQGQVKLEQGQVKLEQGLIDLTERVNTFETKFDRLHEDFTEFRAETRKNFAEISNERKQDRRVVQMISNDLLDTKALVAEAFERIEKLEQKAA